MLLQFSPHLLLSLPVATSKPRHGRSRPPPIRASAPAEPELLAKSALRRISDKLRSLGYLETSPAPAPSPAPNAPSPGEIFVPTPAQLPRHRVGSTLDPSWATGDGEADVARRGRRDAAAAPPSAAELTLPRDELRRLQGIGIRLRRRLKVGKPGVTEGVVNGIHERWRNVELVKIRCDDISAMNMKRTHQILERKTGGLVIWRSGSTIILYRGTNYEYPYFHGQQKLDDRLKDESSEQSSSDEEQSRSEEDAGNHAEDDSVDDEDEEGDNFGIVCGEQRSIGEEHGNRGNVSVLQSIIREKDANRPTISSKGPVVHRQEVNLSFRPAAKNNDGAANKHHARFNISTNVDRPSEVRPSGRPTLVTGVGSPNKFRLQLPGEVKLAEEGDKLLDGLGPRFSDWWGYDPLPVDADLLPAMVPGFRRPFRLLPSGVPPKLTDREMTILRRLARPLPYHYALGRSSNLQGLAASMIKLWERCEVAKIAMKRGSHCIDSELVSEELKGLTGGTLLARDNESIVLYRGKDFLPPAVSVAIEKRRKHDNSTISKLKPEIEESLPTQDASELKMASDASVHRHECYEDKNEVETSGTEYKTESPDTVPHNVETRLSQALAEKVKAEKLLEELEKASQPSIAETRESISEEERYMLRKVGLQMKPFLLLGRRGVFDGTIENMHLHWKYRELVKLICKEHSMEDVKYAARTLEAESGGILVAVERVSKGHAIIMYRGKNYQRPSTLRPKSLLNKKDALKRSVELQRRKSLKLHVLNLSKNIDYLRGQMVNKSHENKGMHDLSNNSRTLEETSEEVPEVALEFFEPEGEECTSDGTDRALNLTRSGVPLDDTQKLCLNALKDDSSEASRPYANESSSTASSDNLIKYQKRLSFPVAYHSDSGSEVDFKDAKTLGPSQAMDETIMDQRCTSHLSTRAAPLTNRERLVLRKQALQMKKRPVLAIGRNNVITGVATTIRTHFKKHPLAIVNIKNRADGTPVQQLISELEEATGSVLVSREPNKVILYRGWGAEMSQKSSKEDSTVEGEKEVISPQLLEAIRLECGFHPGESQ
ncbi:CRM-domain containing factor CFM2, chloroplastic [Lolium rigidum]|uniref:CRM-domain containing factor CFM2, chloroplastic n=1 Tax=Lolium rigidum TaxID=89674 RepID=UPI001F5CA516|nr:CRM-domain containing factor CFM2, chloroplastic [Lolium rigidum]